jgi:hypothetical protein
MLASLIESCKLHGVNPEAYLTDVLTKLVNNWPNSSPNSCLGAGLPHSDRRRQTKPVVKPYRSWPRLIAYGYSGATRLTRLRKKVEIVTKTLSMMGAA